MTQLQKQKNVTIRDIAEKAGVSTMTVTRAFRKDSVISEKTRLRVMKAAEELKFIPDLNAKILRGGSSMSIGILISNPFGNELVRNLSVMLMKEGYVSFIADSLGDGNITKSALIDFCSRRVGGVILQWRNFYHEIPGMTDLLEQLDNVVLCSAEFFDRQEKYDTCFLDYAPAYREAIEKLLAAGRKNIVYLGRKDFALPNVFMKVLEEYGFETKDRLFETSGYPSKAAYANYADALNDKILQGKIPDAIFTQNDVAAAQACACLKSHGIKVPEDVAVIGDGNEHLGPFCSPALASIDKKNDAYAEGLYDMLMKRIREPEFKLQQMKIDCSYVERESADVLKGGGRTR